MRDLYFEQRRLKSARERIMFRETQLRAFYSTTEEISLLIAKQQEQLKSMQKTLVDEENYENASLDIDLNMPTGITGGSPGTYKVTGHPSNRAAKASLLTSAQRAGIIHTESSCDEASVTEKHDCSVISEAKNAKTLRRQNIRVQTMVSRVALVLTSMVLGLQLLLREIPQALSKFLKQKVLESTVKEVLI